MGSIHWLPSGAGEISVDGGNLRSEQILGLELRNIALLSFIVS